MIQETIGIWETDVVTSQLHMYLLHLLLMYVQYFINSHQISCINSNLLQIKKNSDFRQLCLLSKTWIVPPETKHIFCKSCFYPCKWNRHIDSFFKQFSSNHLLTIGSCNHILLTAATYRNNPSNAIKPLRAEQFLYSEGCSILMDFTVHGEIFTVYFTYTSWFVAWIIRWTQHPIVFSSPKPKATYCERDLCIRPSISASVRPSVLPIAV